MPRIANPYYTDPTYGVIAQNLGTALFGNPQLAAQAKLQRSQMNNFDAQAEEARAHGGLYDAQGREVTARVTARNGLPALFGEKLGAIGQANPDDFTPEAVYKYEAAAPLLAAGTPAVPGVTPAVPVVMPTENQSRLLGAVLGLAPNENTAYTVEQGTAHQRADLDSKEGIAKYGDDTRLKGTIYSADSRASTSRYGTNVGAATARRGQDLTHSRAGASGGGAAPTKGLATLVKAQGDAVDAISTASNLANDIGSIRSQIRSGKLKLSPYNNLIGKARNAVGASNQNSRDLASFEATVKRITNDSLRLNKGQQTEGDAKRAAAELLDNINDPNVVQQRLAELDSLNRRAVAQAKGKLTMTRSLFGLGEADTSSIERQPAAVGARGPAAKPTAGWSARKVN